MMMQASGFASLEKELLREAGTLGHGRARSLSVRFGVGYLRPFCHKSMREVFGVLFCLGLMVSSIDASAQAVVGDSLPPPIGVTHRVSDSVNSTKALAGMPDSVCSCHASLPLEIAVSSVFAGVLAYEGYRALFDAPRGISPNFELAVFSPLCYVVSLAPAAEGSSGCAANWWNAAWIGLVSNGLCTGLYSAAYGHNHILNIEKFNWPEYLALGVAPTILASLMFNVFLHPRPKEKDAPSPDQGMYLLPSVGWDKSVAMNFGIRF